MGGSIRDIFRQSPVLATAFLLAALVALFFVGRMVIGFFLWNPPPQEEIRPWMTVGYISRSWNLDPREIDATAGLPLPEDRPGDPRPYTLSDIAQERGVPVEEIIALVEEAIAELLAARPPGGPDRPPAGEPTGLPP